MDYREDINGLRAWAVIAVLLFHFQLPGLGAGFFGVDIFFVISGFLMTAIIVKGLERNNFSIWRFYMARARRILPALMVVIAVLLALGWFWLPTPDYQALGSQSAYSLSFLSNIHFGRSTGYFDAAAHEKWLLHTWSLAVEAQFYLLFPIFLIILWKIKPQLKTLFWGLGLVFIASLALSIYAAGWQPVAAFYLLPTRGWELAAGGLAFLIGREVVALSRFAKPMLWCGFALWGIAFVVLDNSYAWPSGWALLPVLGTVLIILANQIQTKLTVNPVAQWLGDRSYSLYLWHWPLVVALYFASLQNDWLWVSGAIALSLILAHLSYHLVEVPTRNYFSLSGLRKEVLFIGVVLILLISASILVIKNDSSRNIPAVVNIAAFEATNRNDLAISCRYRTYNNSIPGCIFGEKENVAAILIGDSHSEAIASAMAEAAEKHSKGYLYLAGAHGCPTLANTDRESHRHCLRYFNLVVERVSEQPTTLPLVIYTQSWIKLFDTAEEYQVKLTQTLCPLTEMGREVYIARPMPSPGIHVPNTLSRQLLLSGEGSDIARKLEDYFIQHDRVWLVQDHLASECGVKILNPLPYLCDDEQCYGSKNLKPLYYDGGHLSEHGNKILVPMFYEVFK